MTRIPQHLLVATEPFAARLPASRVAGAIARGVLDARRPEPDVLALAAGGERGAGRELEDLRSLLEELRFDARMRSARAVVVASRQLEEATLAGSFAFEIATRARQRGVPVYAITAADRLSAFDARILDLQLVLQARTPRALAAAGRRLAQIA